MGTWNLLQLDTGFEAAAMAVLTRFEGWTKDEVSILVSKTKSDIRNHKIHAMLDWYVISLPHDLFPC